MAKNTLYPRLLLLRTVFHLVYLLSNAVTLIHTVLVMVKKTSEPGVSERLLDMRDNAPFFLSNWNMAFQMTFLVLAVWADYLEWAGRSHKLGEQLKQVERVRDVVYCGLVAPYAVFVTITFWVIYFINRELLFPRVFDEALPWWFNHCVHTNVAVMVAIETLIHPRLYTTNRKYEEALHWTITIVYAVMIHILHFVTGHWLYQIFGVLTGWKMILFQLYMLLSPYLFYQLQFPLNRLIHVSADSHYRRYLDYSQTPNKDCREEHTD